MEVELKQITCVNCNVVFWVTEEHQRQLIKCKNTFYCPNGHPQSYTGDTQDQKIERLEQELKLKEQSLTSERSYASGLARSNAALRGVIKRIKKSAK